MATYEGNKIKLTHHVAELFQIFGIPAPGNTETYTFGEQLEKSIGPFVSTQVVSHTSKVKLAENNSQANEFIKKYDELKLKNIKELEPFVLLLSKMKEDGEIRSALEGQTLPDSAGKENRGEASIRTQIQNVSELQKKLVESQANIARNYPTERLKHILKDKEQTKPVDTPIQPDWLFERPYLSMDYITEDFRADHITTNIGVLPLVTQETLIVEDLLFCLQGVEGTYIKPLTLENRYAYRRFHVDATLDPALMEVVNQILPICSDYSTVVRFMEEKSAFEYGMVNQALSAGIRRLLKDYLVLVCQMETQHRVGQLKLPKILFYLQDTSRLLNGLALLAEAVNTGECIGGAVLSLLHDRTKAAIGEPKIHELYLFLMQAASVPFFEILQKWIYRGVVSDPYREFFIEESRSRGHNKDCLTQEYINDYWEKHYTVNSRCVPSFLDRYVEKILNTGKYLNVVHQCGADAEFPRAEEILYDVNDRQYVDQIERAYAHASRLLLDLMIHEKELKERLKSVKHYFLLDQGDFIVHFMDMADNEMKKSTRDVSSGRLESLLELALRTSTANIDPHKDNLKVVLLPFDLISQMFRVLSIQSGEKFEPGDEISDTNLTGLEAFSFDYHVTWPLSLVLNRRAMERYQMLFRHQFYCKHVERLLCNVWLANQAAKLFSKKKAMSFYAAFALRQRMLNFVQHFLYYMTVEVIEPNWHLFKKRLDQASNLDEVLKEHMVFLCACLDECMLTNQDLLRIVHKLMVVCVTFSNFIQRVSQSSEADQKTAAGAPGRKKESGSSGRKAHHKVVSEDVDFVAGNESFELTIEKFDGNFTRLLVELLTKIKECCSNERLKLMNMVYRLDFNGYYSAKTSGSNTSNLLASVEEAVADPIALGTGFV